MSSIDQIGGLWQRPPQSHSPKTNEAKPPQTHAQPSHTSQYHKAVQMADDLSAAMAQFRRRTEFDKRSPNTADPFERILENDAEPKVEKLLVIAQSSELHPKELLVQARAMFPDDSDLVLVLRELIKRRKLRNENTSVLEEVLQQVWSETHEKDTKAGMNVGIKAQLFAKKMAVTSWALRDTYRQFLSSDAREITQYEQWVSQYGSPRRQTVVEFIETALLHDIQSHDPSCSRTEFGSLLNHVVNLKKLRASDKAFLQVFFRNTQPEVNQEVSVLSCWFDCLKRPFKIKKEVKKRRLSQFLDSGDLSDEVLQQKLLAAVKLLDPDLFFDAQAKDILVEALLEIAGKSLPQQGEGTPGRRLG